jgi:ribosomal protein L27
MTGGFSTPKKDQMIKVSSGQVVKTGHILVRGVPTYKAGINVKGRGVLYSLCAGKVLFTKKKTSHGKVRTFINVMPLEEENSTKK